MGSVVPAPRTARYARALFLEIARQTTEASQRAELPDPHPLAELLADAVAHPESRMPVLLAVVGFITSSLQGTVPNPHSWPES